MNPVKVRGPTGLYAREAELACRAIAQRRRKRPSRARSRFIGVACSDWLGCVVMSAVLVLVKHMTARPSQNRYQCQHAACGDNNLRMCV
jgi:hypothetical protein